MNKLLFERRLRRSIVVMLLCLLALCASGLVFGQTDSGRIVGRVTDQNGAIVPGATDWQVPMFALWLIIAGCIITVVRRLQRISATLRHR